MGADGPVKLEPRQVRFPDLCFVSWEKFPEGKFPQKDRILQVAPDLAIEVLSESNTRAEMDRKLRDYFFAGVQMVWLINPKTQTAEVYTSPTDKNASPRTAAWTVARCCRDSGLRFRNCLRKPEGEPRNLL